MARWRIAVMPGCACLGGSAVPVAESAVDRWTAADCMSLTWPDAHSNH
jgi:hypothetical protein